MIPLNHAQRLPNLASKGQTDEDFVALLLNREG